MTSRVILWRGLAFAAAALALAAGSLASAAPVDQKMFSEMRWRCIGPFRGGRTVGAAGIPDQPNVFFVGVNTGGVWKTTDAGRVWTPIFEGQPTQSIGAIALAPSNPDVFYVGSGEGLQRPDLSVWDGIYRSNDGGKTWARPPCCRTAVGSSCSGRPPAARVISRAA